MPGKFDIHVLFNHWDRFAEGFIHTIEASVLALIGSFVLGVIIAVMRISPIRALNVIGTVYVEFIRNIPLLLVVFFFFLGIPSLGLPLDGFTSGTLGLMVYTASFIAEAIRAGIQSVPAGQTEAARATGLSYIQTMLHIVLPQAIKIVLPAIGNQFINLVKNSSILAVVTGMDLMYYADLINSDTFLPLTVYTIVAVFYLVLTLPLSFAVHYMERRFRSADR
ncbi:amino acid ABC transporter permease [Paenibacillus cellulositrophicus]|uniref:Glutamine ABC transporter permease n=2 Tax=Paenibacillus TaxID=44249 RepID=A0A1R1ELA4_9BACL|nr:MULTISPECIES: amino acid ABC transporter permease [Paenibacillus]OMF52512.1 glutamine ABC transporter permease [Paenibacillus rhizosphaerae]OXL86307.1 glutamine ABC transporter permease [Paenibacillus sp. SSG-1]RED34879.1 amino acid ABC transporter membrane protein 1 (PAAT family) [Paenibacillus sp. VMFN-D1]GIO61816.1 putative glutamine ABC transporter permease protein GlnM [Paenibacillus cineris]